MRNKIIIVTPLVLLMGLVFVLWQKAPTNREEATVASQATDARVPETKQSPANSSSQQQVLAVSTPQTVVRNILSIPRYESDIIRLASRFKITLTKEEIDACQKLYNSVFERRQGVELRIAQRKEIGKDQVEIEIPQYPEGEKLEAEMLAGFERIMGKDKAELFTNAAKIALSDLNHNWGREIQVIKIDYKAVDDYYHITHATFLAHDMRSGSPLIVSESFLRQANLEKYTYLKPLFPR